MYYFPPKRTVFSGRSIHIQYNTHNLEKKETVPNCSYLWYFRDCLACIKAASYVELMWTPGPIKVEKDIVKKETSNNNSLPACFSPVFLFWGGMET